MRRMWRCRSVALFLPAMVAVAAPAVAGDLLIPATGERRAGTLASCDDESCRFDGKAVPLTSLLWIGLGVGEELPPRGIASPGAVLGNGALTAGRLVGLSQGTIVLDTVELDRAEVRWLRIAPVPPPVDVLVRRDGALRTGTLQGCAAGGCTMASTTTPRAELAWIALGVSPETIVVPSAPQDPARDQAQFADGSTRVTPLVGVNAGEVVFASGTFPRAEIAWIYLAPPAEPGGGPVYRPSPPPAPGPPPGPEGAPPPAPPSGAPPSGPVPPGPPAGSPGERGALWTGTLTARAYGNADDIYSEWNVTIDVRLREYSNPWHCWNPSTQKAPEVGRLIRLLPEGSVVRNNFHCSGPYVSCSGSGEVTVSAAEGADGLTQPAAIYLRTRDVDTSDCQIFDVPLGGGSYFLGVGTRSSDTFPVTWVSSTGTSTEPSGFLSVVAGWSPVLPTTDCADREVRNLEGGGGVMRGSYTGQCTGCCPNLTMSWSVCREGASCPPPPELPPLPSPGGEQQPPTDCDETRGDRAQLDLKMDQLQSVLASLEGATAEYGRIEQQAAQWQGDFNQATWDCRLWGVAQMLASFLLSNYAPEVAGRPLAPAPGRPGTTWTGPYEPGKAFANVISMLDKVIEDDGSWLLPDHEFDALFGASAEDVWDGFNMGLDAIGPSAPQDLREGLQSCGAPTLNEVLDGAYEYLRLLEQVKPLADRMHTLLNNARDLDEGIFDFCLSHAKACEDYARCR